MTDQAKEFDMPRNSNNAKCYDCGLEYGGDAWIEATIPDSVWTQISPRENGAGLLCIACICRRLTAHGMSNVPVFLCGTEPIIPVVPNDPDVMLAVARNWIYPGPSPLLREATP